MGKAYSFLFHSDGLIIVPSIKEENQNRAHKCTHTLQWRELPTPFSAPKEWGPEDCDDRGTGQQSRNNHRIFTPRHGQFRLQCHLPRVHGHWTQLTPWLQWTSRPWLALWVLPACGPPGSSLGFSDSHLPATISGFFEPGNPRPEALLDFLCLSKTCQAGYAAFLPLSFPDTSKMPRYQEANEE